jgi:hypothetical protein
VERFVICGFGSSKGSKRKPGVGNMLDGSMTQLWIGGAPGNSASNLS